MRYELADYEWTAIKPMLPNKPRGVPRVNDRRVLNGIFWVLRSGAPWRDLPETFGPYTTCYNRFVRWRRAGVWGPPREDFSARRDRARLRAGLRPRPPPTAAKTPFRDDTSTSVRSTRKDLATAGLPRSLAAHPGPMGAIPASRGLCLWSAISAARSRIMTSCQMTTHPLPATEKRF
jgi:transposase